MSLPKILTPTTTITVDDVEVDIRALTRAEAARLQKMARDNATMEKLEVEILAAATDTPLDEVKAWYAATPYGAVEQIILAVKALSGLEEGAQKSG